MIRKRHILYYYIRNKNLKFKLDNGSEWRIESSPTIEINDANANLSGTSGTPEVVNVPITKNITVNDLINNAVKLVGAPKFYTYDAINNNCQYHVAYLLKGSKLWNNSLDQFVMQNAEELLEDSPLTARIANGITDLSARFDRILHGSGAKIQAVLIDKHVYNLKQADSIIKRNGWKPIKKVHITENYYRYRLHNPSNKYEYKTKEVKKGIILIFARIKSKQ